MKVPTSRLICASFTHGTEMNAEQIARGCQQGQQRHSRRVSATVKEALHTSFLSEEHRQVRESISLPGVSTEKSASKTRKPAGTQNQHDHVGRAS